LSINFLYLITNLKKIVEKQYSVENNLLYQITPALQSVPPKCSAMVPTLRKVLFNPFVPRSTKCSSEKFRNGLISLHKVLLIPFVPTQFMFFQL